MATFDRTDFHGISASAWNMKPIPPAIPSTSWPPTRTVPAFGRSKPATIVRVVDLPHPVGPTTAENWPGSITRSTSRRAVKTDPEGVTNRLVTPLSSILAARSDIAGVPFRAEPIVPLGRLAKVSVTAITLLALLGNVECLTSGDVLKVMRREPLRQCFCQLLD